MTIAILLGIFLGFLTAVPVAGPVSALILTNGLRGTPGTGRWLALGAGLAEGCYGFLAFLGVNAFLIRYPRILQFSSWLAVGILVSIGIYFIVSKKMRMLPRLEASTSLSRAESKSGAWSGFSIGLVVCAANPSLLITWMAAFAVIHSLGLLSFRPLHGAVFSLGITAGICLWFHLFLKVIEKYRSYFNDKNLDRILKGMALIIFAAALTLFLRSS